MNKDLIRQGLAKFLIGVIVVMLIVFLPAGTFAYANGWLFMALLFIPMLIMGTVMLRKEPELLKKRLDSKEKESEQKEVVALSGIMFLAGFITAGLNFRFGWLMLPKWAVIIGAVLFLLSYAMYAEVMRENAYLSRTIEVQENQEVVSTGLYGIVRHPMYTSTILLFLAMPLVLGSWFSFAIMLLYPVIIVFRIRNEEKVLEAGLEGYTEYKQRVRYRLIPHIW